jgi:FlaA1/EpsC-like NDP-sugar epimerase
MAQSIPRDSMNTDSRGAWRHVRRILLAVVQMALFATSVFFAFQLRFDYKVPDWAQGNFQFAMLTWPVIKLLVFFSFGLSRGWWRYVSLPDIIRLSMANVAATVAVTMVTIFAVHPGFPRTIYLIDFLICLGLSAMVRVSKRVQWEFATSLIRNKNAQRALIYGAGDAGVALLRELRSNPEATYYPVGLIDDNPAKMGISIQNVRVVGTGNDLEDLVRTNRAEAILVAMPSASGQQMTAILQRCRAGGLTVKTVPSFTQMLTNMNLASQLRPVAVEDLLGRSPVTLQHERIRDSICGNVVMVSGAAGSIGSELCRQVAQYQPSAIVAFEVAETALFHLENEFRQKFPEIRFFPAVGSIQNPQRIEEVLQDYSPSLIFHAAAYKHVPMMETHMFEAVANNIFGTWNLAMAAERHGVRKFVMISSDKAVRPTNIMGATKRFSELLILSLGKKATKFAAVRFGNVLGSNGSVVPMFRQQIVDGGPVTVTHPDMQRYFMTIPEASQLVLQASTMSSGGDVFVLDMGDPVKIVDLARNLILLSGLRPDEDIRIEFTGARPGEKLFEELSHVEEGTVPTTHSKVRAFAANSIRLPDIGRLLMELHTSVETRNAGKLIAALREAIPDYTPSEFVTREAELARGTASGALR